MSNMCALKSNEQYGKSSQSRQPPVRRPTRPTNSSNQPSFRQRWAPDIGISLAFLFFLFAASTIWQATVTIGGVQADLLMVLAVLASIVDGWFIAGLAGAVWALTRIGTMPFEALLILKIGTTLFAKAWYTCSRRRWPADRRCPYYSLVTAAVAHTALHAILSSIYLPGAILWSLSRAAVVAGVEVGFGCCVLALVVRKLREHHVLNGIKEKNIATAQKGRS